MAAEKHYYADFGLFGPINTDAVNRVMDDVVASAEAHGGFVGGGFVECDAEGTPVHLAGFWRWVWVLAERIQHAAFVRGYRHGA